MSGLKNLWCGVNGRVGRLAGAAKKLRPLDPGCALGEVKIQGAKSKEEGGRRNSRYNVTTKRSRRMGGKVTVPWRHWAEELSDKRWRLRPAIALCHSRSKNGPTQCTRADREEVAPEKRRVLVRTIVAVVVVKAKTVLSQRY